MKHKVKIWYPATTTIEDVIEVDIPDNVDPEDWLYDNEENIIEKESNEVIDPVAFDLNYAGCKLIKE
jgi:hypothetical protein